MSEAGSEGVTGVAGVEGVAGLDNSGASNSCIAFSSVKCS